MINKTKEYSNADLMGLKSSTDDVCSAIEKSQKVLIATHENPDGDAIGSAVAMAAFLRSIGKEVYLFDKDPVPDNLKFLPGTKEFSDKFPKEPMDLLITVDCESLSRFGANLEQLPKIKKTINIDHHLTNARFGDSNLVMPNASSAGEVLFYLVLSYGAYENKIPYSPYFSFLNEKSNEPLPRDLHTRNKILSKMSDEIALPMYTSILSDTGSFNYSTTNKRIFDICSVLNEYNIEPSKVAEELFETKPADMYILLGKSLGTLEFAMGGKISSMTATKDMVDDVLKTKTANANDGKVESLYENFVNYPRSIKGVEIAVFFKEISPDKYKLSLRSKDYANVAEIAKKFGGGGHKFAAGCYASGDLSEIKKEVYSYCEEAILKNELSHTGVNKMNKDKCLTL